MSFSKRLKKARDSRGMTLSELADKIGRTEATVQRYESGNIKNLKNNTIEALAEALNVSPIYLMGWDDGKNIQNLSKSIEVPLIDKVISPDQITAIENIIDYRVVNKESYIKDEDELFFVQQIGNFNDNIIPDESFVLCKKQIHLELGDIAVVLIDGEDYLSLLKVVKRENSVTSLQALNPKDTAYIVSTSNVTRIVGKALMVEVRL